MKMKNFNIWAVLIGLILAFAGCQPEEYELGPIMSKSDLKFKITQDANDPNTIILESLTPGVTPLWQTPMGRSTKITDVVKIPFAGDYAFIYGVMSAGGYIQADTVFIDLTTNNLSYVDDPLWTMLTGGVGHEKTWRLDYGKYGIAAGPLTYCEPQTTWVEWQSGTAKIGWAPSWSDNTWIIEEADTASRMTFSLIGGAFIRTHKVTEGVDESGTFFLNATNHTISTTNATILRSNNFIANATNWNNDLVVLELTENQLMVGVRRTNSEGDYLYAWNFVSEDYAANYVPADLPDPEPSLPNGWEDDISQTVNTTIVWKLSESTPLNWAKLDGSMMNAWNAPEDYPDWLGTPDPSVYGNFSMTLNSTESTVAFVSPDGTKTEGTYSIDEKGIYSFDISVPSFALIGWASFAADANNQLRILQIEKDALGAVKGMWLGARSSDKNEYMAYHLIPTGGASTNDPMSAWKSALAGKTLVPDINYFADWYGVDWSGGWTSTGIFPDNFESQSWLWSQEVYNACIASSISFYMEGGVMKADAIDNGTEKNGLVVEIDIENSILTFSEAPFTFSWIFTNNNEGKGPWRMGSHDGANLSNIATKGFYLGFYSKFEEANPKVPIEITAVHFVLK